MTMHPTYAEQLINKLKAENAELRATLSKMETVEKELRARLDKTVELPCEVGDTLIIETDKLPEGCVPRFYCRVDDKEIDITEYVHEENFSTEE